MKRDNVIKILTDHRETLLNEFSVESMSLFGSTARDEAVETSDVDLLVEFNSPVGMFGLIRLRRYLESILGCQVDLGTAGSLKPRLRARILAEKFHVA
jgi:predicted nucleotidyltransferase